MNIVNFVMGVLAFILGLLLVIMPSKLLTIIVVLLGVASVVYGIYDIAKIRLLIQDSAFRLTVLIKGLVSIVIGILAITLPIGFAGTVVTVMMYILGVYLILCALADFFQFKKFKDAGLDGKHSLFQGLGILATGIIMFLLPSESLMNIILRIIGIVLMLGGAGYSFFTWKNKPIVVEAENVRDADETDETEYDAEDEED